MSLISSHSFQFIHLNAFISIRSLNLNFISFRFIIFPLISCRFISFHVPSFHSLSFHLLSFHTISVYFLLFHFMSCHPSIQSFIHACMHSWHVGSFHSCHAFRFISFHFDSFQFTSVQLTKNSCKQTGSYSHVLFSKLPPRRLQGTTKHL